MIFCGSLSFAGLPPGRNFAKKCHDTPEKRADGAQEQPERGKNAVDRMRDRKRFPVAHNTCQLPTDLIWAERPFDFGLVVPDQIKAIRSDAADPVKYKNALFAAVKNDIAAAEKMNRIRLNDGLIPSGMKKRIHAVALRLQPDRGAVF